MRKKANNFAPMQQFKIYDTKAHMKEKHLLFELFVD